MRRGPLAALALALLLAPGACAPGEPPVDAAAHRADVEAWRQDRLAALRRPDGWLSLAGLFWLRPGESSFGSAADADLRYEADGTPARLGTFTLSPDGTVAFAAEPGAGVTDEVGAAATTVISPPGGPAPLLRRGPLSWHVLRRGERVGVRLRSEASPVLTGFEGIETFPVTTAWRVAGRYEPYDPPRLIRVPDILGGENETPARGALVFEVDGETHRLDVWEDSDDPANHFTAFADATNGTDTYGGGRFLWVDAPAEGDDRVVVDFNRAYNPPCVFTPYATCPLPPRQNRLPFPVPAGEKTWGGYPGGGA